MYPFPSQLSKIHKNTKYLHFLKLQFQYVYLSLGFKVLNVKLGYRALLMRQQLRHVCGPRGIATRL